MIEKLRRRFIRIAMCAVTLVLLLLIAAVNGINFASTNADLNHLLNIISENDGAFPKTPDKASDEAPDKKLDEAPAFRRGGKGGEPHMTPETPFSTRYFTLRYTADGILLQTNLEHIAAVTEQNVADYLTVAQRHGVGTGYKGAYIYRVTAQPNGEYLAVFLSCQKELDAIRTYTVGSCGAGLGCIVLVYVLILVLSKHALAPTVQSIEKQKQFITDASHELKTPLTVISTSQKVLEMEVGQQKWIDKTMAQVDKMRKLVDELVTLSRLDEERPPLQIQPFSATEVVSETAESFRDFALAQGHELRLDIATDVSFCGDQLAVRQLVSVLLDNAVKYADEGSAIDLTLTAARKGLRLTVRNACQPLEQEELSRLFDRFYRVDKSRSRKTGGFGVGLSIARSIAEAHHGSIEAACPDAYSIRFTAVLYPVKPLKKKN